MISIFLYIIASDKSLESIVISLYCHFSVKDMETFVEYLVKNEKSG